MSIRTKVTVILVACTTAVVVAYCSVGHLVVQQEFDALERDQGRQNAEIVQRALRQRVSEIGLLCSDWAYWDDTYEYIQTHSPEYIDSNCTPEAFTNLNLNLVQFYDAKGRLVWSGTRDVKEGKPITIKGLPPEGFAPDSPLVRHADITHSVAGLFPIGARMMLMASSPVLTSESEGPIRGSVVMGRLLSDVDVQWLRDQTGLELELLPLPSGKLPSGESADAGEGSRVWFAEKGTELLEVYSYIRGTKDEPLLMLQIDMPRNISAEGRQVLRNAMFAVVAISVVLLAVTWWSLWSLVVRPIQEMTRHVVSLREGNTLSEIPAQPRTDEVGILTAEFNRMVGELRERTRQLLDAARSAGMADVATEVLHNVGNVLNSINVSAELVMDKVKTSRVSGLADAVKLLHEHADQLDTFFAEDERGKRLPDYMNKAAEHCVSEQAMVLDELQSLAACVDHVKEIVRMQQSYAGASGVAESCSLDRLMDDALRMADLSEERHGIRVVRQYVDLPPLTTEKAKVMQILSNLIRNARDALLASDNAEKVLTLRVGKVLLESRKESLHGAEVYLRLGIHAEDDERALAESDLTQVAYGPTVFERLLVPLLRLIAHRHLPDGSGPEAIEETVPVPSVDHGPLRP